MRIAIGYLCGVLTCIFIAVVLLWIWPPGCCCGHYGGHPLPPGPPHELVEPGILGLVGLGLVVMWIMARRRGS